MGITIHYDLEFNGTWEEAQKKIEEIRQEYLDMPLQDVEDLKVFDYKKCREVYDVLNKNHGDELDKKLEPYGIDHWSLLVCSHLTDDLGWAHPTRFMAFEVNIMEGCEWPIISLCDYGDGKLRSHTFCKTQYATDFVKAHVLVCRILEICKEHGILKEVHDEADFWEERDTEKLIQEFDASRAMINAVAGALAGSLPKDASIKCGDGREIECSGGKLPSDSSLKNLVETIKQLAEKEG